MLHCEECRGPVILDSRSELFCRDCGLVVSTGIEGPTPSLVDSDHSGPILSIQNPTTMTTTPSSWNVQHDASGKALSSEAATKMQYLTTVDSRVVSKQDRSSRRLYEALHSLALRSAELAEVQDRAFYVARKAVKARVFIGWRFSLVAGGAFRFALMERDGYVRDERIATLVSSTQDSKAEEDLLVAYKRIAKVVGIVPARAPSSKIASDLIAELGLPTDMFVLVEKVLESIPSSARPRIDAGAAVYQACQMSGIKISQNAVAKAVGTTDVSLRTRMQSRG